MYVYTQNAHWACECKFYMIILNENFCVSLEIWKYLQSHAVRFAFSILKRESKYKKKGRERKKQSYNILFSLACLFGESGRKINERKYVLGNFCCCS